MEENKKTLAEWQTFLEKDLKNLPLNKQVKCLSKTVFMLIKLVLRMSCKNNFISGISEISYTTEEEIILEYALKHIRGIYFTEHRHQ